MTTPKKKQPTSHPAPASAPVKATPAPPPGAWGKGNVPSAVLGKAAPGPVAGLATPKPAAAAPAKAPAPAPTAPTLAMPDPAVQYTFEQAVATLTALHPDRAKGLANRSNITEAWGHYIFTNFEGRLTQGKVRSTYKSSFDMAHEDEISVSHDIGGLPDIVIHAHLDKDGKPKKGNAVHWKWKDREEKAGETYEVSDAIAAKFVNTVEAKKNWLDEGLYTESLRGVASMFGEPGGKKKGSP